MRAQRIRGRDEFAEALALRVRVFVHEQGVDESSERDALDSDESTVHCIVRGDDGNVLATGRLLAPAYDPSGDGNPHIGRVAVAAEARGTGAGRAVMEFLEAEALALYGSNGSVRVELSAQTQAAAFYERLGYTIHGDEYLDEGIVHRDAFKDLQAARPLT